MTACAVTLPIRFSQTTAVARASVRDSYRAIDIIYTTARPATVRPRRYMVLAALLIIRIYECNALYEFVFICMYISMSYYYSKYEFLGPDSAGVRGGEVQFEESMHSSMRIRVYAYRTRVSVRSSARATDATPRASARARDARP